MLVGPDKVREVLDAKLNSVEIVDVHTHLFPAEFTDAALGIDEILTYHYLIAEYFRYSELDYAEFSGCPRPSRQADLADPLWSAPGERSTAACSPFAEAGLGCGCPLPEEYREYFAAAPERADRYCVPVGSVKEIVMTNDPLIPRAGVLEGN